MAEINKLTTRILLRNDTHENWYANNPVLLAGEVAVSLAEPVEGSGKYTHPRFKVGIDGTLRWRDIEYCLDMNALEEELKKITPFTTDNKTITLVDGVLQLAGLDAEFTPGVSYEPVLVDGKLTWQPVSTTTVEGLSTAIETIKGDVSSIQALLGSVESGTGLIKEVEDLKAAQTQLESDLKAYVGEQIAGITHFTTKVVTDISEVVEDTVLYLIKTKETGDDVYEEWILIDGTPTRIGTTSTDLSNYYTIDQIDDLLLNVQSCSIDTISLAGIPQLADENKNVNIPYASNAHPGVVLSSIDDNSITVTEDGMMKVNNINVNKLIQTEGDTLVIDGGKA